MQYGGGIAPVSNMGAIRKYYCIELIVLNSDAICDFYYIGLAVIRCDTWSLLHRKFYVA
jgi:hypothetical protein